MTTRRHFLHLSAFSLAAIRIGFSSASQLTSGMTVALLRDPQDKLASSDPVSFALADLTQSHQKHGFKVRQIKSADQLSPRDFCILAAGKDSPLAAPFLTKSRVTLPNHPESLALLPATVNQSPLLLAVGADPRGLMYALLELSDRVRHAADPTHALSLTAPLVESPANKYRGICRPFVSDIEDKPWYNDRDFWPAYFAMLASHRFNRFHLALGLGYDFLQGVTDSYLLFSYPFLLQPSRYNVVADTLPAAERDHNLEMLRYISRQCVSHGIDFQLGLWTHGYQFADSPNVNYRIVGLTPENHAAYSRDALAALLETCPDIFGVTLRTHYESGVKEGNYGFWKTVFDGVPRSGRKLQIDLHVKGLDQQMLANATATGMPIMLSPKYWAEHMGLPYQQTAIRDLEMPKADVTGKDYSTLSEGSRIFTRYGYADFLTDDRSYEVMFRVFPGTHRMLLWGDPVSTAAHSRAFQFCGVNGAELFEPLSFKGRRGSGTPGNRCAYADASVVPPRDYEKFLYTYRVWGRLLYNPNTDTEVWRRPLRQQFPACAPNIESALASATRILPLVITAHLPSAAHDTYWPELYTNQFMFDPAATSPYGDTPAPKIFPNVSPLDPEIFSRITDFVSNSLNGPATGEYSPIEVAQSLEGLVLDAMNSLAAAQRRITDANDPNFRRLAIDVRIQIGLGRFFATKLRAGVLYSIYEQTKDRSALAASLNLYEQARELWSRFANEARGIYVDDITYGPLPHQRGNWLNRLAAIDTDLAGLEKLLASLPAGSAPSPKTKALIDAAQQRPVRATVNCRHTPPAKFTPGSPLEILLDTPDQLSSVRLHYRHVNQAERYQLLDMQAKSGRFHAAIPAAYTNSKYPLQYYFELHRGNDVLLFPPFDAKLTNTPYFLVRSTTAK